MFNFLPPICSNNAHFEVGLLQFTMEKMNATNHLSHVWILICTAYFYNLYKSCCDQIPSHVEIHIFVNNYQSFG